MQLRICLRLQISYIIHQMKTNDNFVGLILALSFFLIGLEADSSANDVFINPPILEKSRTTQRVLA